MGKLGKELADGAITLNGDPFVDKALRYTLAAQVGNFNAHRGFSGDAIDDDRLRLHGKAQIIHQVGNAAVFDACFRLEFKRGHHRAGINLRDASGDAEFQKLHVGDKIEAIVVVGDPAYYVTEIKIAPK